MRIQSLLFLFLFSASTHAQISSTEQQIVNHIDAINDDGMELLIESVNINSGTMNFEGVKEVAEHMIPHFKAIGFDAWFEEGAAWDRAGHLIAEHLGSENAPKIMLIGHLDTVFEPDSPFQTFEMINDTTAKGPGIADMKGGNIIMLQALRALNEVGALDDMNIKIVITGDEELSGRPLDLSKKALIDAAKWADISIGFENGDGNPKTANVSRRGAMGWSLTVTGTPAHSSQVFREDIGAGAIYEASRILTAFYEELRSEEFLTFNPGRIMGGTTVSHDEGSSSGDVFGKTNVVAETAIVAGDLRALSPEQEERVKPIPTTGNHGLRPRMG